MNKFVKFYNQNRHMFWTVVLTVIAIIVLIHVLDSYIAQKNEKNNSNNVIANNKVNNNYSIIDKQEINSNIKEVIDRFILLCNNNQIDSAYKMLSDECKENLYPTLDDFKQKYYDKIFNTKKTYICQAWLEQSNMYTYRVDFVEDILATGKISETSVIDYYTVQETEEDNYKLNINKFIGVKKINTYANKNNILIKIKDKKIYKDYEIYDIEVTNTSKHTIMLADLENTENVYIEDRNEGKYYWFGHELIEDDITIDNGLNIELLIKFNKEYTLNDEAIKMVFPEIICYNEKVSIDINL